MKCKDCKTSLQTDYFFCDDEKIILCHSCYNKDYISSDMRNNIEIVELENKFRKENEIEKVFCRSLSDVLYKYKIAACIDVRLADLHLKNILEHFFQDFSVNFKFTISENLIVDCLSQSKYAETLTKYTFIIRQCCTPHDPETIEIESFWINLVSSEVSSFCFEYHI